MQRFAVFPAKRLHAHNLVQFSRLGYVQRVTQHNATHLKHSKHDVHPHNRTTIAITKLRSLFQGQDIQGGSTAPFFVQFLHVPNSFAQPEKVGEVVRSESDEAQQKERANGKGKRPSKPQTRTEPRGLPSKRPQRNLRNGGFNNIASPQSIGRSSGTPDELMSSYS